MYIEFKAMLHSLVKQKTLYLANMFVFLYLCILMYIDRLESDVLHCQNKSYSNVLMTFPPQFIFPHKKQPLHMIRNLLKMKFSDDLNNAVNGKKPTPKVQCIST